MTYTRKDFLRTAALGVVAGTALPTLSALGQAGGKPSLQTDDFTYGLASYSFRKFNLDQVIAMAKRAGLTHLTLKDMHLPIKAPAAEIQAGVQKVRAAGLNAYAGGVIYMKSAEEVNQAFDYARQAGFRMIIGVPNHELLPLVNQKVKEYDVRLAIHNHGPGDKVYPSPESVYEKVKALDKRIGLCLDIGHVVRINLDPIQNLVKYADRIYDIHIKDVTARTADGTNIEIGRGVIDIPGFMRALKKVKYNGVLALEYEINADDPLPGAAESVGYLKGVARMLA
jgi:inosose dehydratase